MPRGKGERGAGIVVPPDWLKLANDMVEKRTETLAEIGKLVSREAGRKGDWDHGAVRRFLDGDVVTREMAIGFARVLKIPQPSYDARSLAEAFELQAVFDKYSSTPSTQSNPDRQRRMQVADQVFEVMEQDGEDHTDPVQSVDDSTENTVGRRRARRPPRSGQTPS